LLKPLFASIALFAVLMGGGKAESEPTHVCHHYHLVAKASSSYRAVCSKGDLNSTHSSRSAAVKAAQKHQKATGHKTSVKKQ